MNDNLNEQLAIAVKKGIELAEKTGEFVVEQTPDLIREFLLWHTIESFIDILICLTLLYVVYKLRKKIYVTEDPYDSYEYSKIGDKYYHIAGMWIYTILGGVIVLTSFIFLVEGISNVIKIQVAPKIYLIEYFLN